MIKGVNDGNDIIDMIYWEKFTNRQLTMLKDGMKNTVPFIGLLLLFEWCVRVCVCGSRTIIKGTGTKYDLSADVRD